MSETTKIDRITDAEAAYLGSQSLGRIATTGPDGQPHVTPVEYEYSAEDGSIIIPGLDRGSKKYRDLTSNPRAGFVVDDIPADAPDFPRGVSIRGRVEVFDEGGELHPDGVGGAWLRLQPERVVSWGING